MKSATTKPRTLPLRAPEIRAILDAGKATIRRAIFKDGQPEDHMPWRVSGTHWQDGDDMLRCPFGEPGNRIAVRETWSDAMSDAGPVICYKADLGRRYLEMDAWPIEYERYPGASFANWAADLERGIEGWWRSAASMPAWAARLHLINRGVQVEWDAEAGGWVWVVEVERGEASP